MRVRPETDQRPGSNGAVLPARASARSLQSLLAQAAASDPADASIAARVHASARSVIGEMVAAEHLPAHLTVAADDAPVVVQRTLLSAWRRVAAAGASHSG